MKLNTNRCSDMKKPILLSSLFEFCMVIVFAVIVCCTDDKSPLTTPPKEEDPDAPPLTWKEHWSEHTQLLKRVYYDDDVAVYFDDDMDPNVNWMFKYIGDVWRYTKEKYGDFGDDPRLYAIFHNKKYPGGHPALYFDKHHDYRNVIDCGSGPWLTIGEGNIDIPTHEVFHLVEIGGFGTQGSPGFGTPPNGIWGDSKFAEIFQYDVYKALGMESDLKRYYETRMKMSAPFPNPDTYWFRDWFYPIYRDHGETQVLVNFFKLVSEHFPKDNNNRHFSTLNFGEFVHFFSAAAGANLKEQAKIAFGWPAGYELEYQIARQQYPQLNTYDE